MTEKQRQQNASLIKFLIVCGIVVVIIGGVILAAQLSFNQNHKFTLAQIESIIGGQIPTGASDIEYDGERGYSAFITLSFRAPPEGITDFIQNICEGLLHQGYDPYDAVNTSQKPSQQPYLIKYHNFSFSYYSYSPDTPQTIWGNRCWPLREGLNQIRVDKGNPDLYDVQFDILNQNSPLWGADKDGCHLIPCSPIGDNFVYPAKVELPLIIIGVGEDSQHTFTLISDEICLEFQLGYTLGYGWSQVEKWKWLIGADVEVYVNNDLQDYAYVSADAHLTPKGEESYPMPFGYCFARDWQPGIHKLSLHIISLNVKHEYTWNFMVE